MLEKQIDLFPSISTSWKMFSVLDPGRTKEFFAGLREVELDLQDFMHESRFGLSLE